MGFHSHCLRGVAGFRSSSQNGLAPFLSPLWRERKGRRVLLVYRSSLLNGFSSADGATALRDMTAMATMVKMKGSIRNAS